MMAMKKYSAFAKALASRSDCLISDLGPSLVSGWDYLSAKMRLVYSIAPINWAIKYKGIKGYYNDVITYLFLLLNEDIFLLEKVTSFDVRIPFLSVF